MHATAPPQAQRSLSHVTSDRTKVAPAACSPAAVLHYSASDLLIGAAIALPSGCALALAITTSLSETIVGVAIATSILPPVVAAGINLSLYMHAALTEAAGANSTRGGVFGETHDGMAAAGLELPQVSFHELPQVSSCYIGARRVSRAHAW